ncbi:uncharacterized protein MYCGRDRAFT_93735 [Zymoseptoria tritici IPO323]|uniref:Uncharacterized protein n=1 Tax=Zymoseptoria tritici (strain CBS 115943 / IPO323) TaxID=336722 RepID=F9XCV0_ZYMTI|nr:uncharacterized protein MYCGRDRAFT_93735 [Zymoseptoria tritici IPO323]EGP86904.1 hypothetical protein MYCGRDRAFT_93735 [Zymoseptoria tritici IPO323]
MVGGVAKLNGAAASRPPTDPPPKKSYTQDSEHESAGDKKEHIVLHRIRQRSRFFWTPNRTIENLYLDLRSPSQAFHRSTALNTKYFNFSVVKRGQLNMPHLQPCEVDWHERNFEILPRKLLYQEAQVWPKPPRRHRKLSQYYRGYLTSSINAKKKFQKGKMQRLVEEADDLLEDEAEWSRKRKRVKRLWGDYGDDDEDSESDEEDSESDEDFESDDDDDRDSTGQSARTSCPCLGEDDCHGVAAQIADVMDTVSEWANDAAASKETDSICSITCHPLFPHTPYHPRLCHHSKTTTSKRSTFKTSIETHHNNFINDEMRLKHDLEDPTASPRPTKRESKSPESSGIVTPASSTSASSSDSMPALLSAGAEQDPDFASGASEDAFDDTSEEALEANFNSLASEGVHSDITSGSKIGQPGDMGAFLDRMLGFQSGRHIEENAPPNRHQFSARFTSVEDDAVHSDDASVLNVDGDFDMDAFMNDVARHSDGTAIQEDGTTQPPPDLGIDPQLLSTTQFPHHQPAASYTAAKMQSQAVVDDMMMLEQPHIDVQPAEFDEQLAIDNAHHEGDKQQAAENAPRGTKAAASTKLEHPSLDAAPIPFQPTVYILSHLPRSLPEDRQHLDDFFHSSTIVVPHADVHRTLESLGGVHDIRFGSVRFDVGTAFRSLARVYITFVRPGEPYQGTGQIVPLGDGSSGLVDIFAEVVHGHWKIAKLNELVVDWMAENMTEWPSPEGLNLEDVEAVASLFVNRPGASWKR